MYLLNFVAYFKWERGNNVTFNTIPLHVDVRLLPYSPNTEYQVVSGLGQHSCSFEAMSAINTLQSTLSQHILDDIVLAGQGCLVGFLTSVTITSDSSLASGSSGLICNLADTI